MLCIINVELGVGEIPIWHGKNRASFMNKLSLQDIGVRTMTTLIDSIFSSLASRSHGQSIIVRKNIAMKSGAVRIIASKKVVKVRRNVLKDRNENFALIATYVKLGAMLEVSASFSSNQ
jgi:hypothetical protein